MSISKTARGRSSDSAQERLRQRKAVWNKACSEFIARLNSFKPHLISFKRGLNGRGDAKAGLPISNIKDPLPNEVGAFLNGTGAQFSELASTFSALISEATGIIQEQADYSSKRRKPQDHMNDQSSMVRSDISYNDDIIVESSNAISRLWANLSSILSRDATKQHRLSMLRLAHELFQILVDFEDAVLTRGIDNIPLVLNQYFKVSNKITALSLSAQRLIELKNEQNNVKIKEPSKEKSVGFNKPEPEIAQTPSFDASKQELPEDPIQNVMTSFEVGENAPIDELKNNIVSMMNSNESFDVEDVRPFLEMYHKRKMETNEAKKDIMEDRLRSIYEEILEHFNQIKNDKNKKAFLQSDLSKYANNYFSRLLKEYRHQFGIKDSSSASRMAIFALVREAKRQVDDLMDLLEKKDVNVDMLTKNMSKIEELVIKMSDPIKLLNVLYKDKYYEDKRKQKDPIIDPAGRYFTKQIRKDVDKPGW